MASTADYVSALVGMGGAILGYDSREYRNGAHPFFQVLSIDGGLTKRSDPTHVPASLVTTFEKSFYPGKLEAETTFGEAYDCCVRIVARTSHGRGKRSGRIVTPPAAATGEAGRDEPDVVGETSGCQRRGPSPFKRLAVLCRRPVFDY